MVGIGADAFIAIRASEPYCVPGDMVLYVQNAGRFYSRNDKHYLLIKEGDILAVLGTTEEEEKDE